MADTIQETRQADDNLVAGRESAFTSLPVWLRELIMLDMSFLALLFEAIVAETWLTLET